jgi:hypothetical protein
MRTIQIVLLSLSLLFSMYYCDPVDCLGVKDSIYGKFTTCNSTKPFPLKLSSNILITKYYYFGQYSWGYVLRSYKGEITKITGCL